MTLLQGPELNRVCRAVLQKLAMVALSSPDSAVAAGTMQAALAAASAASAAESSPWWFLVD